MNVSSFSPILRVGVGIFTLFISIITAAQMIIYISHGYKEVLDDLEIVYNGFIAVFVLCISSSMGYFGVKVSTKREMKYLYLYLHLHLLLFFFYLVTFRSFC